MKIRFSAQGIRLRLTSIGLEKLIRVGYLECNLEVLGRVIGYRLELIRGGELSLQWSADILQIFLPELEFQDFLSAGKEAKILSGAVLIEKDFRNYARAKAAHDK